MAHQAKKAKTENNLTAPWMQVITDVLEHKDNKEFLDASAWVALVSSCDHCRQHC